MTNTTPSSPVNKELEDIKEITASSENECKCKSCVNLCKKQPCLGTPTDILNIVKAGYSGELAITQWAAGLFQGIPMIPMVQALYNPHTKACIFLDDRSRCKLHKLGLKPTEGKLTTCSTLIKGIAKLPIEHAVALTWTEPQNATVLQEIINELKAQKKADETKTEPK